MTEISLTVHHEAGLHARPLARFVQTANRYDAEVQVTNVTRGKGPANGKSPLSLMLLAVLQGHEVRITTTGPDAAAALAALQTLIDADFAETP